MDTTTVMHYLNVNVERGTRSRRLVLEVWDIIQRGLRSRISLMAFHILDSENVEAD